MSVCSTAVPHESENSRQHAFPSYVACRTGRGVLPIPGHVGVRRERGKPFPFTTNVLARALQWIQTSRIVVLVHKLERNHSCFDILLIYYFLLKIYFSGCFDEVREGCGCFQDKKGFSANWSR